MRYLILLTLLSIISCSKEGNSITIEPEEEVIPLFIRGVDISAFPQIEATNPIFHNLNNQVEPFLTTLKNNGVNTVRLKLWKNPSDSHASFAEVKTFSERLKSLGIKIWLTVHYSDTWADPGHQEAPLIWQNISFDAVKDSMYAYTQKIVLEINPDFIQIGNEINPGFLYPYGKISTNEAQFKDLLATGVQAVRDNSNRTKIIIHFAGIDGSNLFFNKLAALDYDIIGISYYPKWHGKDLNALAATLSALSQTFNKDILIAETAYPFTLNWNDWTHNIIGTEDQLILPAYPATPQGQQNFIAKIKEIVKTTPQGIGFCYWGAELIAFMGPQATNGSPWENQALFDFDNKALPVLNAFKSD